MNLTRKDDMKNIFDFLVSDDDTLNEEVFDSFSQWVFEGDDPTNRLSREFLRWSFIYIIKNADEYQPNNDDFYAFFEEFDRTDFDAFLNHVSKFAEVAVLVEQTLGSDQDSAFSGDNQATYWYFIGKIMEHVEQKNLFPDEEPETQKNAPISLEERRKSMQAKQGEKQGLSEDELSNVSNIFAVIFVVLLVAFFLFNFFFSG